MPNHAPVVPAARADQFITQSLELAGVSLETTKKLRTLFRTIVYIPDNNPTTQELAALGAQLADEWANVIDCEREDLEQLTASTLIK
ncbi:hypothetical protein [Microbulbifer sp. 2205BS26-8]|uniref:hypothetical protein n=1 Tax=Microbulbifer sp. 2205BS26-8 TaxID=3064386 RepID=UPI00273DAC86|nr:hypothetical protein [Microbulbifer sp. 2205BS26-8]MDP5210013.1 hypothetical protein [Microbulbifer sp. 2205BS26-8]